MLTSGKGLIVAVTSACKSYGALVTTRVLLGVFESAVAPSLILITSMCKQIDGRKGNSNHVVAMWSLTSTELTLLSFPLRFLSLAMANSVARYFQGTNETNNLRELGSGILEQGRYLLGIISSDPFSNHTQQCLGHAQSSEACSALVFSIIMEQRSTAGYVDKTIPGNIVLQHHVFIDPQTWLQVFICISSLIPNGAVSSFHAQIIEGFGFNSEQTALLQIPSGAIAIICIVIATWLAGRYNMRGIQLICLLIPGIIGGALMAFLPEDQKVGKLIGNYLTNCIGSSLPLLYSWVSVNYAGHTKMASPCQIRIWTFQLTFDR